ncbi:GNAT family N-acetyltransferase [Thermovibrio sp.]
MEVKVEKGRVFLKLDSENEAFITFGIDEDKKVIVVSTTFVPKSYRGKGIAGKLTAKLVEFAQENGYKIYPLCSYTQKYLQRKRPDLLAEPE